jgi:uncharacterized protein (DUF1330 family)
MAAYVISEVEALYVDSFEQYRTLAKASIDEHGGRYLVRATLPEAAEGDWPSQRRLVIVEFADMDTARRWYSSDSYARALAFRDRALSRRLVFVEGIQ